MFILSSAMIILAILLADHTVKPHNHDLSSLLDQSDFEDTQFEKQPQSQTNIQTPVPQSTPQSNTMSAQVFQQSPTSFQPKLQLRMPTSDSLLSESQNVPALVSQSRISVNNEFNPSQIAKSQFPKFQMRTQQQAPTDFNRVPQQMAQAAFQVSFLSNYIYLTINY